MENGQKKRRLADHVHPVMSVRELPDGKLSSHHGECRRDGPDVRLVYLKPKKELLRELGIETPDGFVVFELKDLLDLRSNEHMYCMDLTTGDLVRYYYEPGEETRKLYSVSLLSLEQFLGEAEKHAPYLQDLMQHSTPESRLEYRYDLFTWAVHTFYLERFTGETVETVTINKTGDHHTVFGDRVEGACFVYRASYPARDYEEYCADRPRITQRCFASRHLKGKKLPGEESFRVHGYAALFPLLTEAECPEGSSHIGAFNLYFPYIQGDRRQRREVYGCSEERFERINTLLAELRRREEEAEKERHPLKLVLLPRIKAFLREKKEAFAKQRELRRRGL